MIKKQRKVIEAALIIILGLLTIIFAIFSDTLRGRPFSIGWAQVLMILGGVVLIIAAIFHFKGMLIGFIRGVLHQLNAILFHEGPTRAQGKIIDAGLLFVFFFFAIIYFLGFWDGLNPVLMVDKNGDGGALISYAAALDHPGNFANDQSLSGADGPISYFGIFLPFIRFFGALLDNYGLGFLLLTPVSVFLHLFSFYLLGKELFHNRFWGLVTAVVTGLPIYYLFWDFWGIVPDPLPRFVFQSVFPLVLWAFLKLRDRWRWWPGLMVVTVALAYLHVISTPLLAFMVWVGFWFYLPRGWKWHRKISFQLLNGLVFLIPFAALVISSKTSGGFNSATQEVPYQALMEYLDQNFYAFLHLNRSLPYYLNVMLDYGILAIPLVALAVIFILKAQRKLNTYLILIWLSACLVISVAIPVIEHAVEKALGIPPLQVDLVRNLRFTIPLVELLGISGFVAAENKLRQVVRKGWLRNGLRVTAYAGAILWLVIVLQNIKQITPYEVNYAVESLRCFKSARLFCPTERQKDEAEILRKINDLTPVSSTFLAVPFDDLTNEIRYGGLRSIAFTRVDKNRVVYNNFSRAQAIQEIEMEWDRTWESGAEAFTPWITALSCKVNASHWLIDKDAYEYMAIDVPETTSVFDNGSFEIVQAPDCQ